MSKKGSKKYSKKAENDGCAYVILALIPALIIYAIIRFVVENYETILAVLSGIGVLTCLIFAFKYLIKHHIETITKKQNMLDIINSCETKPDLMIIPTSNVFSCEEEKNINYQFRKYLQQKNEYLSAQSHCNCLEKKLSSLSWLRRLSEEKQIKEEIDIAADERRKAYLNCNTKYESQYNKMFYEISEIKNAYNSLQKSLSNHYSDSFGNFFNCNNVKVLSKYGNYDLLIFTPAYLLRLTRSSSNIKLINYKDIEFSTTITTQQIQGKPQLNDEIDHISYTYVTKDGQRDMRYNAKNNREYIYVRRGIVKIRCEDVTFEQEFTNKSLAIQFEKMLKEYISLLSTKYSSVIYKILSRDEAILSSGAVEKTLDEYRSNIKSKEIEKYQNSSRLRELQNKYGGANPNDKSNDHSSAKNAKEESVNNNTTKEVEKPHDSSRLRELQNKYRGVDQNNKNESKSKIKNSREEYADYNKLQKEKEEEQKQIQEMLKKEKFLRTITVVDGTLTEWRGTENKFVLPEGVASSIGAAFKNRTVIESIILPQDIVSIKDNAFFGCAFLRSVDLSNSVKDIGESAFSGCKSLNKIKLPEGLIRISSYMFKQCTSLKSITIPYGVKIIEKGAFSECTGLQNITIPSTIVQIENHAFENCSSLKRIVLPDSVNYIENNIFEGCDSLERVTLGRNIKKIPDKLLLNKSKLQDVTISSNITKIGDSAFKNCSGLKNIFSTESPLKSIPFEFFENIECDISECFTGTPWLKEKEINGLIIPNVKTEIIPERKKNNKVEVKSNNPNISDLTEDEYRMVMEMRRKKHEERITQSTKVPEKQKIDYEIEKVDANKVYVSLATDTRKIVNNIFVLKFIQDAPVNTEKTSAEFESFVIDSNGQIISSVKNIVADKTGDDLVHKITFSLSSQEKFDRESAYYVVVRYKGKENSIISKTEYQISIEFASDFDF